MSTGSANLNVMIKAARRAARWRRRDRRRGAGNRGNGEQIQAHAAAASTVSIDWQSLLAHQAEVTSDRSLADAKTLGKTADRAQALLLELCGKQFHPSQPAICI
mgnify:CR=1 FL=1